MGGAWFLRSRGKKVTEKGGKKNSHVRKINRDQKTGPPRIRESTRRVHERRRRAAKAEWRKIGGKEKERKRG